MPDMGGHVHIPDGFINAPTSLAAGAVAAGGVGVSLRRAAQTLQERQAPLAGLVAAYIFAVQMLNFPVAAGTSGHLLGGVLAAVLVGPWAGALCIAVVLVVQALFADGGLTALIGSGGGAIPTLTVGTVLGTRPDLVYGASDLLPRLVLRTAPVSTGA